MAGGLKHDQNKLRMDLITPEMLEELAGVLTFGAAKYGDENWKQGLEFKRNIAAALRHINEWRKGNNEDDESGWHHLSHAAVNLLMVVHQQINGREDLDDRPKTRIYDDVVHNHSLLEDLEISPAFRLEPKVRLTPEWVPL